MVLGVALLLDEFLEDAPKFTLSELDRVLFQRRREFKKLIYERPHLGLRHNAVFNVPRRPRVGHSTTD